jgi:hypothetical protein
MHTLAPCHAGRLIAHVPDQRVDELKRLSLAQEYALVHPLLQQDEQLFLAQAAQRAQDLQRKALAQAGCQRQKLPAARTELLDAGGNRARDMLGKPEVGGSGRGDDIPATFLERILLHQMVKYLLDEERVPLCRCTDRSY